MKFQVWRIRRSRSHLAHLLIGLWTVSCFATVSAETLSPGIPNLDIGAGFDSQTYEARDDCIVLPRDESGEIQTDPTGGGTNALDIQIVESSADFRTIMGFTAEAAVRAKFFPAQATAKARFASSFQVNRYSVLGIVRSIVYLSPQILRNPTLTDTAIDLLTSDLEQFWSACGNEYVRSYRKGGELYGLIRIDTTSEQEMAAARSALRGGIGSLLAAGAESEESETSLSLQSSTSVEVYIDGSDFATPTTLANMIEVASNLRPNILNDQRRLARFVSLNTAKYENLQAYAQQVPPSVHRQMEIMIEQRKETIGRLANLLSKLEDTVADIDYALEHRSQFEWLADDHTTELEAYKAVLLAFRDGEMRSTVRACYDSHRDEQGQRALNPRCMPLEMPDGPALPELASGELPPEARDELMVRLGSLESRLNGLLNRQWVDVRRRPGRQLWTDQFNDTGFPIEVYVRARSRQNDKYVLDKCRLRFWVGGSEVAAFSDNGTIQRNQAGIGVRTASRACMGIVTVPPGKSYQVNGRFNPESNRGNSDQLLAWTELRPVTTNNQQ